MMALVSSYLSLSKLNSKKHTGYYCFLNCICLFLLRFYYDALSQSHLEPIVGKICHFFQIFAANIKNFPTNFQIFLPECEGTFFSPTFEDWNRWGPFPFRSSPVFLHMFSLYNQVPQIHTFFQLCLNRGFYFDKTFEEYKKGFHRNGILLI